jgi:uncharacterized protein with GYD domain
VGHAPIPGPCQPLRNLLGVGVDDLARQMLRLTKIERSRHPHDEVARGNGTRHLSNVANSASLAIGCQVRAGRSPSPGCTVMTAWPAARPAEHAYGEGRDGVCVFFRYTSPAWARMISTPDDRTAAVWQVLGSPSGSLDCIYWMIGSHDGIAIPDLPDSVSAAAMYIAAASSGDFTHNQTHQPLTQEQLGNALQRASTAAQAFQPPGQQTKPWRSDPECPRALIAADE